MVSIKTNYNDYCKYILVDIFRLKNTIINWQIGCHYGYIKNENSIGVWKPKKK